MSEQDYEQLTLFPEDSHVNRFPLPGSAEARRMTVTSGQKWLELSKNSGPLGLLEKMLLESSEWHSPIYYLNWKGVDIGQGHFLFQLALSEPDTEDIGWQSSQEPKLWKTPIASDAANREMYVNSRGEPNLSGQVKLWPTPKANCGTGAGRHGTGGMDLQTTVKMWPTPTRWDYKDGTKKSCENVPINGLLGRAVHMFPHSDNGGRSLRRNGKLPTVKEIGNGRGDFRDGAEEYEPGERRTVEPGLGGMADGIPDRLDGYWDIEPDIPRVAAGIPNRVDRLKALGNAVVPQQFYPIFMAIAEIERGKEND